MRLRQTQDGLRRKLVAGGTGPRRRRAAGGNRGARGARGAGQTDAAGALPPSPEGQVKQEAWSRGTVLNVPFFSQKAPSGKSFGGAVTNSSSESFCGRYVWWQVAQLFGSLS